MFNDTIDKSDNHILLSEEIEVLKKAQKIAKLGSWQLKIQDNILTWSDETYRILGIDKEKNPVATLEDFFNIIHPDDRDIVSKAYTEHLQNKKQYSILHRLLLKNGTLKYVKENCETIFDKDGKALISNGTVQDITESKIIEKQINDYVYLVDQNIITSSTDLLGNITSVSQAFCDVSGYTKEELIGQNHRIIRHLDMDPKVYEDMWKCCINNEKGQGEIKNKTKDGGYYWVNASIYPMYDESHKKIGYTGIRQNITDKKIIEQISITDGLTNIFNRRHFNDIFPRVINSAKRHDELLCFLIIDVDHFKQYNDTYGHQKGDEVLISIASSLKELLHRADDYCFRLGGEEFGIIFKVETKQQSIQFSKKIITHIEGLEINHKNNSVSKFVTVSMGLICRRASEIDSDDQIYKQADDLLYKAKRNGRNQIGL